ncbi:hypothetical protein J2X31_003349 [Flavobacterium arsenatis]|uniref:Uncharacterized protein n=1 Tax=Flavobacterium arsenatis TaxID=1484332 RepID=A0ABU1TTW2_9FLAO|nr:DUF6526 family protein [Flavobacterium arsenatis]MDR6969319.1 hypothetical protein [Flavobacterium arsenatis]
MKKKQSYTNHIQFYPAHHFVFYPLATLLLISSISFIFLREDKLLWSFISVLIALIIWVSFMLRQHYALILQNRIIRLEMRYRYFVLTNERFELIEHKLRDSQIFALRFASDDELPGLVKKALEENLSSRRIKRSILMWIPDNHRV